MNLVFLGPPGAGKGTQASRVSEALGIPHISTGAMLREAMLAGTELGKKAKATMDTGALVSDDIVIGIVRERLKQSDCENGFLLDGFPRTVSQAEVLDAVATVQAAVNIDIADKVIVDRIAGRRICKVCGDTYHVKYIKNNRCPKCGGEMYQRSDDTKETVQNRIEVYNRQTKPLIDYYKGKGTLINIDGDRDVDVVLADILKVLKGVK